ncbi:hypothetical protein PPACK8108_LOCUS18833 [Phakopsora pachyrhizi]|uniref:Cullin N-terminal domain-containing protein n=1 Tax=Phakopsora pachyrhizi TaxID=170000 RepID=A0AAV0BDW4_PHAPC|nr:hypothetical protein PPACK8108_LOCUS18833 [Phakopsora pachyrhizi]
MHVILCSIFWYKFLTNVNFGNHLAKRLFFGKSFSEDTERNMLIKLKDKSGSAFTRDSEGLQHKL